MLISFFLNLFFNFPTSLQSMPLFFLYCKLRSSTVVIYAFCTPPHLWNCTVNYILLIFYATPSLLLYTTMPLDLCGTVKYKLVLFYVTPSLCLYATLSCCIFLYAFFDTCFLNLYAFTNRNLTTAKLNVSTILHYAFLLCYIFNCTLLYILILILSPANLIFHLKTGKILLSP